MEEPLKDQSGIPEDLSVRTKRFALEVIRAVSSLPKNEVEKVLGNQLLRSGTSVGANYREAKRGRSKAEFQAKLGIAQFEAEESQYWIELLRESGIADDGSMSSLWKEAGELQAIFGASIRTSRG